MAASSTSISSISIAQAPNSTPTACSAAICCSPHQRAAYRAAPAHELDLTRRAGRQVSDRGADRGRALARFGAPARGPVDGDALLRLAECLRPHLCRSLEVAAARYACLSLARG